LIDFIIQEKMLKITGEITYKTIQILETDLAHTKIERIDLHKAEKIDTSGVVFILELMKKYDLDENSVILNTEQQKLFDIVKKHMNFSKIKHKKQTFLYNIGVNTTLKLQEFYIFLSFVGQVTINIFQNLLNPKRIRVKSIVNDIENMGLKAVSIIALVSFLIGIVIAYQGSVKLKEFGANIFVVDLVSISMVRELGPLLVAIILAGRSSSSYTAQIGIMKVTEEIDVIKTMGIPYFDVLVFPKVASLLISVPILIIVSDLFGILGGMLVAKLSLNITVDDFILRLHEAMALKHFFSGIIKAPVFAILVASIGCFKGFRTKNNVESIGKNVTSSVVDAIFSVIVADAIFSVLFRWSGI